MIDRSSDRLFGCYDKGKHKILLSGSKGQKKITWESSINPNQSTAQYLSLFMSFSLVAAR